MAQLKPSDYVFLNAPAYYLEEQCGHTLPERESPCVLFREDTEFLAEAYLERYLFPRLHGSSSHLPDPVALETASSADPDNLVLGFKNAHPSVASVVAPVADLLGPSRFFVPSSRIFFSREVNGANMSDSCLAGLWSLLQDSPGDAYVSSDLAYVSTDVFSFPSSYGAPWAAPDQILWADLAKTSYQWVPTRETWSGETPLPPVATVRDKAAYSWFAASSAAADSYALVSGRSHFNLSGFPYNRFCVPDSSLVAGRGVFDGTGLELARDGNTLFGIDSGSAYPGDFPLLLWRLPAWYHGLLAHPPAGADASRLGSGRGMLSRTCTRPGAVSLYGIREKWSAGPTYSDTRSGSSSNPLRTYANGIASSSEETGVLAEGDMIRVDTYLPLRGSDGVGQAYVSYASDPYYIACSDAAAGVRRESYSGGFLVGAEGVCTIVRGRLYVGTASDPYPAKALRDHVSSVRVLLPYAFICDVDVSADHVENAIDSDWVTAHPDAPSSVKEHIYRATYDTASAEKGELIRCGMVAFPASYDADSGRWYVDGAGVSRFLSSAYSGSPSFVEQALAGTPGSHGEVDWESPSLDASLTFAEALRKACSVSDPSPTGDSFVYDWGTSGPSVKSVVAEYASVVSLSRAMVLVDWNFPATPPDSWVWPKPAT